MTQIESKPTSSAVRADARQGRTDGGRAARPRELVDLEAELHGSWCHGTAVALGTRMSKRGKRQHRVARRHEALREAATSVTAADEVAPAVAPAAAPPVAPAVGAPSEPAHRRRRAFPWVLVGVGAALVLAIVVALTLGQPFDETAQVASPTIFCRRAGWRGDRSGDADPDESPTSLRSRRQPPRRSRPRRSRPLRLPRPEQHLRRRAHAAPPAPTAAPPPPPRRLPRRRLSSLSRGPDDSVAAFYRNVAGG